MQNKLSAIALLFMLGAVWGSSFIFMKLGMEPKPGKHVLNHFQVAGLRMLIAGIVTLPFAIKSWHLLKTKNILYFLIVGLCGNFIPSYLFTYAGTTLSSGFCGILNSFTPIFTVLIGVLAFRTSIHWLQIIGILIGSAGIYFLITAGSGLSIQNSPKHIFAILTATLLYGISVNTIRHKLGAISPIDVTALGLFCIMPFSFLSFLWEGTYQSLQSTELGWQSLVYVFILGALGTAISNIYFNRLIKMTSAIFASSVTYLIPLFAVIFGFLLNETISTYQLLSMFVLLCGVFLVNFHELILGFIGKKYKQLF